MNEPMSSSDVASQEPDLETKSGRDVLAAIGTGVLGALVLVLAVIGVTFL